MHEWSLLLFTLSLQIAAGGFTALAVVQYLGREKAFFKEIALFAAIGAVGACFSLTHLGDMFGAYRALYNLGTSWLSREVWLAGAFAGAAALGAFSAWRGNIRSGLLAAVTLLGLAAVYASSAVYASTIMDKWAAGNPYLEFFASTLLIGPVIVALPRLGSSRDLMLIGAVIALGTILLLLNAGMNGGGNIPSITMPRFLVVSLGIAAAAFTMSAHKSQTLLGVFAVTCLVLGEGLGRYLFFME